MERRLCAESGRPQCGVSSERGRFMTSGPRAAPCTGMLGWYAAPRGGGRWQVMDATEVLNDSNQKQLGKRP